MRWRWTRCVHGGGRVNAFVMLGQPAGRGAIDFLQRSHQQAGWENLSGPGRPQLEFELLWRAVERVRAGTHGSLGVLSGLFASGVRHTSKLRSLRAAVPQTRAYAAVVVVETVQSSRVTCSANLPNHYRCRCACGEITAQHSAKKKEEPCQSRARASPASSRSPWKSDGPRSATSPA